MNRNCFQASRIALTLVLPLALAGASLAEESPTSPNKPVVSDIIIRGNRVVSCEVIKQHMRTRVGSAFHESVLQADLRALQATRQFSIVDTKRDEDGPGRIKLVVHIRDWPTIQRITYQGAGKLRERDLEAAAGLRHGGPCNPDQNKVACRNVERYLRTSGYPRARCSLLKGGNSGDTEVKFDIVLGERRPR